MVDNAENDKEWILEIMAEYLQSPVWKNPIISFVEEHCIVFEDTEENSLDYTEVHASFKRLVESKLEAYIQDLGISQQDFVLAQSRASSKIHKSLLQQVMAVEDFVLFKKMMVNRNIQMNKEAMKQMQAKGRLVNHISKKVEQVSSSESDESEEEDEDEQMREAMAESKRMAEIEEATRKQKQDLQTAKDIAQAAAASKKAEEVKQAQEEAKQASAQAAAEDSKRQEEEEAKAAEEKKKKIIEERTAAAKRLASKARAAAQAQQDGSLPQISGGLPSLNSKPKATGLALFGDIEIKENDAADVKEEKNQRQALKDEKSAMIAERNQKRQQEFEAAEKARQASQETEDQEAKAARIQRGLQALQLAPTETSKEDKRAQMYKNLRQNMD